MESKNPILDYLNAIYRYRLVAVCAFSVGIILTVWTVRALPDVYRSTTLIMVEPQDVPDAFVRSTVTTRLEARLNALNQEVLSRTRLEAIINDFDLFHDLRQHGTPMEVVVESMRSHIKTEVYSSDNAFRISYEDHDPSIVQRVTARLAGLYIDENLKIREEHVSGTTEFLQNELEKAKHQIETADAQIQKFKQEHMGELPEQREANIRALEGLRVQQQTITMAISSAKERKLMLDKQADEMRAVRSTKPGQSGQPAANPRLQLRDLEVQLASLRARYTAEHPDVIRLQRQIDEISTELQTAPAGEGGALDPLVPPELAHALQETALEITRLTAQKENIEKAITAYQQRVDNTFVREQELLDLTRDYGSTQKQYQSMLDKKLDAQLSQSLERRQKGERFRVLDPASFPQSPVRPNRSSLTIAGLGGSLLAALGLPILLGQLDTSFHVADELVACAAPVLAVIPQMPTPEVLRRRRRYRVRVLGLTGLALIVGLGTVSFYARYLF
ncbi:MAG TPA: XrtA system polysaccharide chain length determinant [Candidatus Margulisiibacteriota bacterium]|nr:XrtA system polysaccharide chain length determinant [Candidatus Margulisiibacteriota bacterium]